MAIVRDDTKSVTRRELEERLKNVGDYVKMDLLSSALKKNIDFDTKKFVLLNLADIYESRKMFSEAAKMMKNAAEINTTYNGKMDDFTRSGELFIHGGNFVDGEVSFTRAMGCATELQKSRLKILKKEAYKKQAKEYFIKDKRSHAMATYEKLLSLELTPEEKKETQTILLGLYEKLGKVKDFYALKTSMQ